MVTKHYSAKEVEKILRKDGWYEVDIKGGHKHFKHPTKKGKTTVPTHEGKKLGIDILKRIEKQSGIKF